MAVNTTKSIKKTSTVLADEIEKTKANMKKLMAAAGAPEYKTVRIFIPMIPGSDDDVVFVGLNGVKFYFMRGQTIEVPDRICTQLHNCGVI